MVFNHYPLTKKLIIKMIYKKILLIGSMFLIVSGCGVKKPLQPQDINYPAEEDCDCANPPTTAS